MPDESRDSQLHTTITSLKATHTAHRVASAIHSTPTRRLQRIVDEHEASLKAKPRTSEYRYWLSDHAPNDFETQDDDTPIPVQPCLNAREERIFTGFAIVGTILLIVIIACNWLK